MTQTLESPFKHWKPYSTTLLTAVSPIFLSQYVVHSTLSASGFVHKPRHSKALNIFRFHGPVT